MSKSKPHMLQLMKQFFDYASEEILKLSPEKSFFLLLTVEYPGYEGGVITIEQVHSKIAVIH